MSIRNGWIRFLQNNQTSPIDIQTELSRPFGDILEIFLHKANHGPGAIASLWSYDENAQWQYITPSNQKLMSPVRTFFNGNEPYIQFQIDWFPDMTNEWPSIERLWTTPWNEYTQSRDSHWSTHHITQTSTRIHHHTDNRQTIVRNTTTNGSNRPINRTPTIWNARRNIQHNRTQQDSPSMIPIVTIEQQDIHHNDHGHPQTNQAVGDVNTTTRGRFGFGTHTPLNAQNTTENTPTWLQNLMMELVQDGANLQTQIGGAIGTPNVHLFNIMWNAVDDEENQHASETQVNELPVCSYSEWKETQEQENNGRNIPDSCPISQETFQNDSQIIRLPCEHIFLETPIRNWLLNYSTRCPVCRNQVF